MMDKPKTAKEIADVLWVLVVGVNGSGMMDMMKQQHEDMDVLKIKLPELWTRADHEREKKADNKKTEEVSKENQELGERRKISTRDWIMISANLVMAIGVIIAMVWKI